jgi:hypothetical protein
MLVMAVLAGEGAQGYRMPERYETKGEIALKGSRSGIFTAEKNFRFNAGEFIYKYAYRLDEGKKVFVSSSRLGFRKSGHAGGMELLFGKSNPNPWHVASAFWLSARADGSAVGGLTVPLSGAAFYRVRIVEQKGLPDWLFLRFTFAGISPSAFKMDFDGGWTAFTESAAAKTGACRMVAVDGKIFSLNAPPPKDFGKIESFVFCSSGAALDSCATAVVVPDEQVSASSLRFRKWGQCGGWTAQLKKGCATFSFAVGNIPFADAKREAVQFTSDAARVKRMLELLVKMDWDPVPPVDGVSETARKQLAMHDFDGFFQTVHADKQKKNEAILTEIEDLVK